MSKNKPENIEKRPPSNRLTVGSPFEETLKLLIENLKVTNQVVTTQSDYSKKAIDEILIKLSKIQAEDITSALEGVSVGQKMWKDVFNRIAESKRVDVHFRDIDYVLAELVIEAYSSIVHKKKYAIIKEWGTWAFGIATGAGLLWIIKLLMELAPGLG